MAPSKVVQHVLENYSEIPSSPSDFLNGHALYIFIDFGRQERRTTRELLARFPPSCSSQNDSPTDAQVDRMYGKLSTLIVKALGKNRNNLPVFSEHCLKAFLFPSYEPKVTPPTEEKENTQPPASLPKRASAPVPGSPVKTRQTKKCGNCQRLRTYALRMEDLIGCGTCPVRNNLPRQYLWGIE